MWKMRMKLIKHRKNMIVWNFENWYENLFVDDISNNVFILMWKSFLVISNADEFVNFLENKFILKLFISTYSPMVINKKMIILPLKWFLIICNADKVRKFRKYIHSFSWHRLLHPPILNSLLRTISSMATIIKIISDNLQCRQCSCEWRNVK